MFAGLMFTLRGPTRWLSWVTASRWAMDAMGASVGFNQLKSEIPLPPEAQYASTPAVLLGAWGALVAQSLALAVVAWWLINRRR